MGIVNQDTKFNGFFSPFSVDNPNRVVITNNQGYAIASDITYQQLIAVISGGGTLMGADNGLHTVGTVVKLGGVLLEPTVIDAGVLSFTVQNGLNNTYMTFAASGSSRGFSVNAYSDSLSDLGYLEASIGKVLLQYSVGANRKSITLSKTISGIEVFDQLNSIGLRYNSDYSANNTGVNFNARWIPDLGYLTSSAFTSSFILNQNSVVQTVAAFRISGSGQAAGYISDGNITPLTTGTRDLGTASLLWNNIFASGTIIRFTGLPANATTDFDVTIDASGNLRKSSATIAGSYILNQTAAPQASSVAWLGGGAEALKVGTNTGNPDHAFIGLYARTATPTNRNAVIGYTTAASTILSFVAETSGHQVSIRTTSGNVGISALGAGNAIQIQADQIQQQTGGSISNWNNVLGYDSGGTQNILLLSTGLGNVPNGSKVILRTNSGTGSVASTLSGNILGQYILSGYLTSAINYNSISIQGLATESWSASAGGSKLEFYTTKNTTIAQVKALTIDQDGSLVHTGNRTGTAVNGIGVDTNGKVVNLDSSTLSGSVTTTTATVTTIATIATVSNQVYLIYAPVLARRTDVNGEIATYPFYVTVKNIGGTLTVSSSSFSPAATEDDANYNVSATTSGTNILIQVTGVVGKTINWSIKNGEVKSL